MGHITIESEYFQKSLRDYNSWEQAWPRELLQNSIDCGSNRIEFKIAYDPATDTTHAECTNNGPPMDRETITDKFLSLGGSSKDNKAGSVGGFGVAKTVICLAHQSYTIHTGQHKITGSGGNYEISQAPNNNGTTTKVQMAGNVADKLLEGLKTIARYSKWNGHLIVNGETVPMTQTKGAFRRELRFGKVYSNNKDTNVMVIRANGLMMYSRYISMNKLVIIELDKSSVDVLTSNRDGMRYPYYRELNDLIDEISVNKRSALKRREPKIIHYPGFKLAWVNKTTKETPTVNADSQQSPQTITKATHVFTQATGASTAAYHTTQSETQHKAQPRSMVEMDFYLLNETYLTIPSIYIPTSPKFSQYSSKLIKMWSNVMIKMHDLFGRTKPFSVGFIFGEDTKAAYNGDNGNVFYVAPADIVRQNYTDSKSLKKGWSFTNEGKKMMVAIAAHEFTHSLGHIAHDENFSSAYTDIMGKVLAHLKDFNQCFRV